MSVRSDSTAAGPLRRSALVSLAEAGLSAAPVPDLRATSARLLDTLVRACGASRASLLVLNPETGRLRMMAAEGLPAEWLGHDLEPRPRSIAEAVLRNRRPLLLNGEVRDAELEGSVPAAAHESAMVMPLMAGQGVIGVLNLSRHAPIPPFTPDDLELLRESLPPIAGALERSLDAQQADALMAQLRRGGGFAGRTFLPQGTSEVRGWEMGFARIAGRFESCDWVDRVAHERGAHTVFAADPSGRGVDAALTGSFAQGLLIAVAAPERTASGMVARVSAELHGRLGGRSYVALWIAQLAASGLVCSCNAGHPAPLWVPSDGSEPASLSAGGPVAGALPRARYEEEQIRLLPGDLLIAASDGLLDARDSGNRAFGSERLAEFISDRRRQPLESLAGAVVRAALEHGGRSVPVDDMTVLALRYAPGS